MDNIIIGYSYHIKDTFFNLVNDSSLMSNKENGGYRPHFYCVEDENNPNLYWVIPISSRTEKYKAIRQKKIDRYGKCNTIVIGLFSGAESAFLIQNMFPVISKYIDHVHTKDGIPVTIHKEVMSAIKTNVKYVLSLHRAGIKIVFSPIDEIKQLMDNELS